MNRFVRPETTLLTLANGDTLVVRTRLNTGETRQLRAEMFAADPRLPQWDRAAYPAVCAYLLDWTITNDGRPVPIRDQPADELRAALNALDYDDFMELAVAINEHHKRQDALRADEKKTPPSETRSSPTSPSPFAAAGATSGSGN